jgi:molybdate/tungstate transport system permease protein
VNSLLKNSRTLELVFTFVGGLMLLFIVAPLAGMYFGTSLHALSDSASTKEVQDSIWLSLWTSMAGTVLFSFLAIPLAYILARKQFPLKNLVNSIVDIPIIIPHSAAGIAVLGVVSRTSALGQAADSIGLRFVGHPAGIIVAMAFVSIPFMINAARDGFAAVPERFERIAMTLGASPARAFFTISLPLAWRSILSGFILMWGRGMSEFGAVIIIAYNPQTAPVMIYERFTSYGLAYSLPIAALFVAVCLSLFLVLRTVKKQAHDVETR